MNDWGSREYHTGAEGEVLVRDIGIEGDCGHPLISIGWLFSRGCFQVCCRKKDCGDCEGATNNVLFHLCKLSVVCTATKFLSVVSESLLSYSAEFYVQIANELAVQYND